MTATLWLVSPVYHDAAPFLRLRRELLDAIDNDPRLRFSRVQFVAVDDTAGHDREIAALEAEPDVLVVYPPFNLGHQRAIVYGLRNISARIADGDFIVTLDSDGEDQPADLPRLLAPLLKDPENTRRVAIARRTQRRESFTFKISYFFFRLAFRLLTGLVIRSGNYVAYRGWLARRLLFHPHFDLCYSSTFISLNLEIDYVPAARGRRYGGRSRMTYAKLLLHGLRMLLPFTDRIAVRGLIVFSLLFAASNVTMLTAAFVSFLTHAEVSAWLYFSASILALFALLAAGNLTVMLAAFIQSRGNALRNLERENDGATGISSAAAD